MNKGLKQFLIKTGVFAVLFIGIQLFMFLLNKAELPNEYYFLLDMDIGKALLFTAVAFFFLSRKKLNNLKEYQFEIKSPIISGILSLTSFAAYFFVKVYLSENPVFATANIAIFYPLKEILLVLGTIFLFIAVFGFKFSRFFIKEFKKEIGISVIILAVSLFLLIEVQRLWFYLSNIVARVSYFFLNIFSHATLYFTGNSPNLGVNDFIVNIGKPCSGIDSMLLFIFLYFFIVGFDWKALNKKKAFAMFIPGLVSVFLLNIIRITLLIIIGAFVSRDFAIGLFHTNASWILFIAYFALFWGVLYKWMKKKEREVKAKQKTKNKHIGLADKIKNLFQKIAKDSLYKNSILLMLNTGMVSLFGFVFWIINARLFTAEQVGLATTLISVATLIITFSLLGLNAGIVRYLSKSKTKNEKINTCLTIVGLVAIAISVIFILGINLFSPKLAFIKDNMLLAYSFIIFMVFGSFSSMIESIFIAYRNTKYILLKNVIFSTIKIILPFALVFLGAYGIFGSWMIGVIAGVIVSLFVLVKKFKYKFELVYHNSIIKKIGKYSFGNYVAGFIYSLPTLLLPLIITNSVHPEMTAYYYMAMMVASTLFIIPQATSNSLFAEGSHNEKDLHSHINKSIKIISLLMIPAIILTIIFGKYILLLLGKDYSAEGEILLALLAFSGIFISINSVFTSIFKVQKNILQIIIRSAVGATLLLSLSWYFITYTNHGLAGIGYAWIIGQGLMSILFLVMWFFRKKK